MDMGMSRPYDDAPSVQPPYHGGGYGPGTNMGGPAGMAPPAMGPPPGMSGLSGPGPQHMGGAPPPQTHSILANLTPQQREQFQKLINSTPEHVRQEGYRSTLVWWSRNHDCYCLRALPLVCSPKR